MEKLPLGIQLYSLRDDCNKDFEGTLAMVSEMGYSGVELTGTYGKSAKELTELCRKYNLCPISAHVSLGEFEKDIEKTVSYYKEVGCEYVVIPWIGKEYRAGGEKHSYFIDMLTKIGTECNKNGITLLYHNHWFEFEKTDGEYFLDMLYAKIPADILKTEFDTCWVNAGGENPVEYIKKYKGRIPLVHLKDFTGLMTENTYAKKADNSRKGEFSFAPLGHGWQDMKAIISASAENGAKWLIYEQDDPSDGMTPLECAQKSAEYYKSL